MFISLLALDLQLSTMARSIGEVQVLLCDEFLSGKFAVGVVYVPELGEGSAIYI